jgi:hypothetical protein
MAIKGGQILHSSGTYVLDRIQSSGPGDLNIPEEKIYELGNYESVATVRDIPEISFDLESYDMTTEFECILTNKDPVSFSSSVGSNDIDFGDAVPIDIISPWKSRRGQFDIVKGVIIPYLTLESASYRFGVGENSSQSFSLRGDSIFYTPGQPWYEEFTNTGIGPYTLENSNVATVYNVGLDNIYVLSVCLVDSTTNAYKRLFFDDTVDGTTDSGFGGYTNTTTSVTLPNDESATYDTVRITYGTDAGTFDYTQTGNNFDGDQLVHQNTTVKPAAIRGKDIDIYIGIGATPAWTRLNSVQNVEVTWTANLENDEELGNERYVSTEYDVPEVNGSIGVKPFDPADLFAKISQITGVDDTKVIGPNVTTPVALEIRINHPDSGARLKTLYIPDARFSVPGYSGQANTTLETSMSFTSDGGNLTVYNGSRV